MRSLRRFLTSILIFIGMLIVLGSAAFAWISIATINNVEGLSMTVSSGDELLISFDGVNYGSSIPFENLSDQTEGIKLFDVTSPDGVNFELGGLRSKGEAIPNQHYISFDLWLRSSELERDIYLFNNISNSIDYEDTGTTGTYITSKGVVWRSTLQFFNGPSLDDVVFKGDVGTYFAKDAMRLSIVELKDDLNPFDVREESELRTFIFDPSGNPERGYAATFGQFSYFFQRTLIYVDLPDEIPNVSYRLSEMDPYNPYQALDNESLIATLQPTNMVDPKNNKLFYTAKIRINIWIEGWDADAFDAIDQDMVKIQLQFKSAKRA